MKNIFVSWLVYIYIYYTPFKNAHFNILLSILGFEKMHIEVTNILNRYHI